MGVNKGTVSRWKQAGRLVLDAGGRVMVEESRARILHSRAGRTDVADRHARNRGRNLAEFDATIPQPEGAGADLDLEGDLDPGADGDGAPAAGYAPADPSAPERTRYKARQIHYENARIKLELSLRHGYRLPLAAVEREAQGIGNVLRAAVERLVDVCAPQAAHMPTSARSALLASEARALRRIATTELARSQRRIRKETTDA